MAAASIASGWRAGGTFGISAGGTGGTGPCQSARVLMTSLAAGIVGTAVCAGGAGHTLAPVEREVPPVEEKPQEQVEEELNKQTDDLDKRYEVEDIPALWDEQMMALLGVNTRGNFRDGPMQDVHWAEGLFGYFACYTLGAMYAARTRHWYLAGVAGAAAALSRPYGVLISIPLVVEYLRQNLGAPRDLLRLHAAALLLPGIALLGWLGYLNSLTGDPLVFVHAQAAWNQQQLTSPLETLVTGYRRTRDQQLAGRLLFRRSNR